MITFDNKKLKIIVGILLILLMGKSCQSCSRGNAIEYKDRQLDTAQTELVEMSNIYNKQIDSLNNVIRLTHDSLANAQELKRTYSSLIQEYKRNLNNQTKINELLIKVGSENDKKK